jgi:hypothetical protein
MKCDDKYRKHGIVDSDVREKCLSKDIVQNEQLEAGRQVSVNAVFTEVLVVFYVIFLSFILELA